MRACASGRKWPNNTKRDIKYQNKKEEGEVNEESEEGRGFRNKKNGAKLWIYCQKMTNGNPIDDRVKNRMQNEPTGSSNESPQAIDERGKPKGL